MGELFNQLVINEFGNLDSIQVRQIEKPTPTQGQILIQMKCAPINVSDLASLNGSYWGNQLPQPLGLQGSGLVISSGGGQFADSLVGKKVAVAGGGGTYSQYLISEASQVFPLQDEITYQQAASMIVNPMTVAIMIDHIKSGNHQSVFINAAASALGKMLVRWCIHIGVKPICFVRREQQRELIQREGAQYVFLTSEEGWKENCQKLSEELKTCIGFDAVAGSDSGQMMSLLQPRGVMFVYGNLTGTPEMGLPVDDMLFNEKQCRGLFLIKSMNMYSQEEVAAMAAEVQGFLGPILRTEYAEEIPLQEVKNAIDRYTLNKTNSKFLVRLNH